VTHKGSENLKPFKKGDPRINRNGRPKSFDTLRKLAQQLLNEVAKDNEGNPLVRENHLVTSAELILLQMMRDKKQRKDLLEIAYGKVPDEVNLGGNVIIDDKKETDEMKAARMKALALEIAKQVKDADA